MQYAAVFLAGLAMAMATPMEPRQLGSNTANDVKDGPCKPVTFIMARGSTETGNMGTIAGPPTCDGLKKALGEDQVACQGIGADDGYAAALPPNFMPKNTDTKSIAAATKIMTMAATKCPDSTMLIGGYSQGSAVVDNAIQGMPADMQAKIAGVVLFGFTRNEQDNGQIPGYPAAQTKVICAKGDMVCNNTLTITAAHLSYAANAPDAASFLAKMAKAAPAATTAKGATAKAAKGATKQKAAARMAAELETAKIQARAEGMI